ncbi:hypothetical protein B0G83_104433 [Paraburkholderia sp. BL21I4N1]|nr:hypothetical protein B0G83_104433 [Paraburkholderia sp. BL21I4N1]
MASGGGRGGDLSLYWPVKLAGGRSKAERLPETPRTPFR